MAFDVVLGERLRKVLKGRRGIAAKKMFGGLIFFHRGNMLIGVWKNSIMVRLGREGAEQSRLMPHVRPFHVTGKAIKNWILVDPEGLAQDSDLGMWVEQALEFVRTLPPKG